MRGPSYPGWRRRLKGSTSQDAGAKYEGLAIRSTWRHARGRSFFEPRVARVERAFLSSSR